MSPPKGNPAAEEAPRFDDLLVRLRGLVEKLENGNLSLEDSLKTFEEGVALCRRGATILDGAEKRVEVLLASSEGRTQTAPFEGGARGARDDNNG